jgi:hypothetical protein
MSSGPSGRSTTNATALGNLLVAVGRLRFSRPIVWGGARSG